MSEEAEKQTNQAKKHAEEAEGQLLLQGIMLRMKPHGCRWIAIWRLRVKEALEDVERMKHSYNAAQRRFYDYEK